MQNVIDSFKRMGIKVDDADASDDIITVTLTIAQFEKLQAVIENVEVMGVSEGRIIATLSSVDFDAAVEANAKAPRPKRTNPIGGRITSKMVYYIDPDDEDVNEVDYGEWCAIKREGYIRVNGNSLPIITGKAEDYYDVGEDGDPERTVYAAQFTADGESVELTAYGVLNLIKRLVAFTSKIS